MAEHNQEQPNPSSALETKDSNTGDMPPFCRQQSNDFVKMTQHLQDGDLIEFKRFLYSDWAIYIGDGKVISLSSSSFNKKYKGEVRVDHLEDIVGWGNTWSVNNSLDSTERPYSKEEIVTRAFDKLGGADFNFWTNNSEHFATWCRYGKEFSNQIEKSAASGAVVGRGATTGYQIGGPVGAVVGARMDSAFGYMGSAASNARKWFSFKSK